MMTFGRKANEIGRMRALLAKIAPVVRPWLPWAAERHRLAREVVALRAVLARQDEIIAGFATERERLRNEAALLAVERDKAALDRDKGALDRDKAALDRDKTAFDRDMLEDQLRYARDVLEPERDDLIVQRDGLEALLSDETLDLNRRTAACERVILHSGLEPVVRVLERLRDHPAHAAIVARGLAQCNALAKSGILDELDRVSEHIAAGRSGAGALLVPLRRHAPSADKIVLVFMGAANRFWMSNIIHFQALRQFGPHLVFLKDARPHFYMDGIEDLRPGYENSLADLRALCASMGDLPIYCIGSSMGGFGALRYGLDLGADAILALSTWTTLAANVDPPTPAEIWASRHMGANAIDLKPLFAARANIPRLTLYHGALNGRDTRHAQRCGDLPGARVIGLEGYSGHDSFSHLVAQRKLDAIFAEFLAPGGALSGGQEN
jgi:hypothetical protein